MDKTAPRGEPPPLDPARDGLFLDYDGTLVAIAPTPDEAVADDAARQLLRGLERRLDGALAIVTGRPVGDIDRFLAPLRLTVAGLHGLDLRPSGQPTGELPASAPALAPVRQRIRGAERQISWNFGRGQAVERRLTLSAAASCGRERVGSGNAPGERKCGHVEIAAGQDGGRAAARRKRQGDCHRDACRDCAIRRAQAGICRR